MAAKDAYHEAIDSGDADTASTTALGLGALLVMGGDVQGAKDAFQKAIDSGSADAAPMAAIGLGELLADEGDMQGAKDAFQKAIDSGRPNAAHAAAAGLGMLTDQGALSGSGAAGRRLLNWLHSAEPTRHWTGYQYRHQEPRGYLPPVRANRQSSWPSEIGNHETSVVS
jgi:tetratricopeptide (TPR) repeat protein